MCELPERMKGKLDALADLLAGDLQTLIMPYPQTTLGPLTTFRSDRLYQARAGFTEYSYCT